MMKHLLSKTNRGVLEHFARTRVLLGFDFDGTLAPIVADPRAVRLRRRTRRLLRVVAERYPCAVISGRARSDVLARLDGIPVTAVVGSHGLEPNPNRSRLRRRVRPWVRMLHERLDSLSGVVIEDKGVSVAVHYRGAPQKSQTRNAVLAAAAALGTGVRVVPSRLVVDLLPDVASHKGVALRQLRAQVADTAVYVGDDASDEDVFNMNEPGRLLSIRVGRRRDSAASYFLRTQGEVDDLLEELVRLRNSSRGLSA
jgi:trehalose 6-phosphate phosphatase